MSVFLGVKLLDLPLKVTFHFQGLKGFSEWNLCPRFSHKSCQFDCGLEKALSTSHCVPWCSSFHENIIISLRYLPHREDAYRKTCRSYKSDSPFVFSFVYLPLSHVLITQCARDSRILESDGQCVWVGLQLSSWLWPHQVPLYAQHNRPHVSIEGVR